MTLSTSQFKEFETSQFKEFETFKAIILTVTVLFSWLILSSLVYLEKSPEQLKIA